MPPPPPLNGTHFSPQSKVIDLAASSPSNHAKWMEDLLESSIPPDEELTDLIEQAFIEGQIDGLKADLAFLWLSGNSSFRAFHT